MCCIFFLAGKKQHVDFTAVFLTACFGNEARYNSVGKKGVSSKSLV